MNAKFYLLALPLLPLIALAKNVPNVHQQHTQQLDVHQHGFGILSLALNEQQLVLELLAPAADIVGFEHAPQNIEQEQQQAAAFTRVQDANLLFTLPKQAQCSFIKSELLVQDEDELHEDAHEHAKPDAHQDEAHTHDQHPDHDHEDDHEEHGHSDVLVKYHYQCLQPHALTRLDTQLFEQFASLNHLELQGIVASGQVAATLTPAQAGAAW